MSIAELIATVKAGPRDAIVDGLIVQGYVDEAQELRAEIAELEEEREAIEALAEDFAALRRDLDASGAKLPFALRLALDEFGLRLGAPR
jgi:hypothetical protein